MFETLDGEESLKTWKRGSAPVQISSTSCGSAWLCRTVRSIGTGSELATGRKPRLILSPVLHFEEAPIPESGVMMTLVCQCADAALVTPDVNASRSIL